MISVDEALSLLAAHRPATGHEVIAANDALGRVLAQDITARLTLPPHAVSAMDGYALRFADLSGGIGTFKVIGEAPAGHPFAGSIGRGEAVRLFTGSHVPSGADHVVIQEHIDRGGSTARVVIPQSEPRNIRRKGIDFAAGDELLKAGTKLGAGEIATIAAADYAEVSVRRPLTVAIIGNGDELRAPGSDPLDGSGGDIVASNYSGLSSLVKRWGGVPDDCGIARDNVEDICARIDSARGADVIVPVGGASVGDHDHMAAAFAKMGLQPIFKKIAVRPGKPTWFGTLGKQLVLGLPGNPASAYVCAQIFLRHLLEAGRALPWQMAALDAPVVPEGPRESFLRGVSFIDQDAVQRVTPLSRQDSSLITPFLKANCLIRRLPHADAAACGDLVQILPLQR